MNVTSVTPAEAPFVVAFSRRRTRARAPAPTYALPDWVWGVGLGAVVLIGVGAFLLFTGTIGGGGGGICDNPLKPIPDVATHDATAEGFQQEWAELNQLIGYIQQGNLDAANQLFYGATHNFMHTADPVITEKNPTLGKNLCNAVIAFENDFEQPPSTAVLVTEITKVRDLMADGAVALGFPRPSG